MLRFIGYLDLLESKIDDLEKQNPTIPVRQYATHDKSPTKKFLPWLVKQHKLGNVTPDHPDLAGTLGNFDKYKSKHGINDHTQHSFQEVADAVRPHIGTTATNKERQKQQNNTGVEVIHKEPNGITSQHIKTKEASQNMYGGGHERGGEPGGARGTSWCVSARSNDCLFKKVYGKMYTVHDPNDDDAPYAVHPEVGKITSRHNNGDKPIADVLKEKPHLATAVDKIQDHYIKNQTPEEKILHKFKNTPDDITENDINKYIKHPDKEIRMAAIKHPKVTADHITHVLTHENNQTDSDKDIRMTAISHPKFNSDHITHILTHEDEKSDPKGDIRKYAIKHEKFNADHIMQVLKHSNNETDPGGDLRKSVILHKDVNENHITHILKHENNTTDPSGWIRHYAIKNEKATKDQLTQVLTNKNNKFDSMIRRGALTNPNIESSHILQSLTHENEKTDPTWGVRVDALYHPKLKMSHVDYMMKYRGEEDNYAYKEAKKRLELEELSKKPS